MKSREASVTNVPQDHTDHLNQIGLERLVFFSDGVFAIAITLLALEIRLPAGENILSENEMLQAMLGLGQHYLGYFISFLAIGVFWIAHHRKFRFIQRYDSRLLMLNLLLLMVVAFIPFPSSLISEYPNRTATIFYALTMILAAILFCLIWWYATWHNRLVDDKLDVRTRRRQFISPLLTGLVFTLSIAVAYIDADLAKFCWLLIIPAALFTNRD